MWSFGVILYVLLGGYPPFHDEDQKLLFKRIKAGVYAFHEEYWSGVPELAKDLIRKLLVVDPRHRLSADEALAHPWLHSTETVDLGSTLAEIKKFQAAKRFKKGVNAVKAINKMKKLLSSVAFVSASKDVPHTLDLHYELGDVLGEGGYAVVKAGVSKIDRHEVAVKVMKRAAMDAAAVASVRNEVSVLQSLNHPNIVGALDFFEEPEHFYFVLEKVSGGELFDRIVQKTFYNEKEARDLVKTLLDAIHYMHKLNIVHRDLKPENLLMTSAEEDADVKIVDFGFAALTNGSDLSEQCGTPGYIAPEILLNKLHGGFFSFSFSSFLWYFMFYSFFLPCFK
jgi:serine/threonine protein kinase